jgi:hypothetical protein
LQAPAKAKASKAAKVLQSSLSSNQDQTIEIHQPQDQDHKISNPRTTP